MTDLYEILNYADGYLDASSIKDYCPKGLQVEGRREVGRIVSGVSACVELFEEAVRLEADAVLVHHGMFWDNEPRVVRGGLKSRLSLLLKHDISLIAYHLPLDRHPEVGNNIQLVRRLGLIEPEPFGEYGGKSIGYIAKTLSPIPAARFADLAREAINPDLRHYAFGRGEVELVAVCSGGAPDLVREAVEKKADVYMTGEDAEWIYHLSKEEGIHYVSAGHHATERFGVMALGEHLGERFGVDVRFVDIYNPI